jgi:hypothetical protein
MRFKNGLPTYDEDPPRVPSAIRKRPTITKRKGLNLPSHKKIKGRYGIFVEIGLGLASLVVFWLLAMAGQFVLFSLILYGIFVAFLGLVGYTFFSAFHTAYTEIREEMKKR